MEFLSATALRAIPVTRHLRGLTEYADGRTTVTKGRHPARLKGSQRSFAACLTGMSPVLVQAPNSTTGYLECVSTCQHSPLLALAILREQSHSLTLLSSLAS